MRWLNLISYRSSRLSMIWHILACYFRFDAQTIPFCRGTSHIISCYTLQTSCLPKVADVPSHDYCEELLLVSTGSGQRSATSLGRSSSWVAGTAGTGDPGPRCARKGPMESPSRIPFFLVNSLFAIHLASFCYILLHVATQLLNCVQETHVPCSSIGFSGWSREPASQVQGFSSGVPLWSNQL